MSTKVNTVSPQGTASGQSLEGDVTSNNTSFGVLGQRTVASGIGGTATTEYNLTDHGAFQGAVGAFSDVVSLAKDTIAGTATAVEKSQATAVDLFQKASAQASGDTSKITQWLLIAVVAGVAIKAFAK